MGAGTNDCITGIPALSCVLSFFFSPSVFVHLFFPSLYAVAWIFGAGRTAYIRIGYHVRTYGRPISRVFIVLRRMI